MRKEIAGASLRSRIPSWTFSVFVSAVMWIPAAASADTVVVEASRDNTMFEEDGTLSNGAGDYFFAGNTKDGFARRGLIAFDIAAAVPEGATIDAVTLTLSMSRTKTNDVDIRLYRATSDWGEGTSDAEGEEGAGAMATSGDATWTYSFYDTSSWAAAGGDFAAISSAATFVGQEGTYTWSSAGMVADVQDWLDGTRPNYGWVVRGDESGTRVAKRFDSRTHSDPSVRPTLAIDFTPQGTSGACCASDGTCTVASTSAGCGGTYQGDGTVCSPNPCPQPTGACCHPDASATCTVDTGADCMGAGGDWQGSSVTCSPNPCPVVLTKYIDPLPRPKVATPTSGSPGGAAEYTIAIRQFTQQLHSELPETTLWGYDDGTGASFPGPTIEARTDEPVTVTWHNDLRDSSGTLRSDHMLPVQSCLHGAETNAPRVVTHLHGGHVAAASDGYPEDTILPGETDVYEYPNWQQASQIWYHDHALGITRHNVYLGLAGLYMIRDDVEDALALPSGDYEVPLVIQDRTFEPDGSLYYPAEWQEHFFGDTILVNGQAWPYLEVDQGKYRFRVLNGSNGRTYTLSLSTGDSFQVIGNDGGLLETPVTVSQLTLGPAERADVVVDFEGYPAGTEIVLENSAGAPFPGSTGVIPELMMFVVSDTAGHTAAVPGTLRSQPPLSEADSVVTRDFELEKVPDTCKGTAWRINGLGWEDITETPQLGTTEIWRFINKSGTMHPMHMHLVFFQVIDRTPIEFVDGTLSTTGPPQPPEPHEQGWKDTVQVGGEEMVRVIARFEDFVGRYPYHCHILEHEDHEMMRQFEARTTCGDGARGLPVEECDDGGESASCDADCTLAECGDGTLNATAGEECDDGDANSDTVAGACRTDCTLPSGTVDAGVVDAGGGGDGGTSDAGVLDAGRDAGGGDAGGRDAGVRDDAGPGSDAGLRRDTGPGGDAGGDIMPAGDGGCSCHVPGRSEEPMPRPLYAGFALALGAALRSRKRRRQSSC